MITRHLWEPHMRKHPIELPHSCPEKPTVSVIVPTYNHEDYINECIDGILMQEDCDFEAIIIEDESSDQTREICIARQRERPDRLRLILNHRENNIHIHGRPTGRFSVLYALERCRGGYIALCEGDDYWIDARKLHIQAEALGQHPKTSQCMHPVTRSTGGRSPDCNTFGARQLEIDSADACHRHLGHTSSWMFRNPDTCAPQQFARGINFDSILMSYLAIHGDALFIEGVEPNIRHMHQGSLWAAETADFRSSASEQSLAAIVQMHRDLKSPDWFIRACEHRLGAHRRELSRQRSTPRRLARWLRSTLRRGPDL